MSTDYRAFLQRLETFDAVRWQPHTYDASPIVCARCGWRNAGFDILRCDLCQSEVPFVRKMIQQQPGLTREQSIEDGLMELHDVNCLWRLGPDPPEFGHLQTSPFDSVAQSVHGRFDNFDVLWDLPMLQEPVLEAEIQSRMELLSEFLIAKQLRPLDGSAVHRFGGALRKRVHCQLLLALLGWELNWVPRFIYLINDRGLPEFTEGLSNDPLQTQIAFGRQAYITCPLCQATLGLWSVETFSEMTLTDFRELRQLQEATVENQRPWRAHSAAKPNLDVLQKRPANLSSAEMHQPVFGMKRFARVAPSESLPSPEADAKLPMASEDPTEARLNERFSECHPIVAPHRFDPIEAHLGFCPYRSEWTALLRAVTQN